MLALYNGGSMLGAPSPAVQQMQTALKALAQASGKPLIDPGNADGVVGNKTVTAVLAGMGLLKNYLGSAGGALQAGLSIFSIADHAKAVALITQYASQIEQAARAATVAIVSSGSGPQVPVPGAPTVPMPMPGFGTPWYKTWWGIGGLTVAGVGVLLFIFAPTARRTEAQKAA